jgi:hypothetical protein
MKLYPQCHPYWIEDDKKLKLNNTKVLTHTSTGYIVPCCHTDITDNVEEFTKLGMLDEELKVKNVNKIEDILLSKQWLNFHRILVEEPENAPRVCKRVCGKKMQILIDEQ